MRDEPLGARFERRPYAQNVIHDQRSSDEAAPPSSLRPDASLPTDSAREPEVSVVQVFKRLGPAGILAIVAGVAPALGGIVLLWNIGAIGTWLAGHKEIGFVIYVACFMLLAGLALLPTYAQSILGGWAFGFAAGFPAALLGFFGASLLGYDIARAAARERAMKLLQEHPKWIAVRDALVADGTGGRFWKTLGMVTLLRLPPNSPFALTNLVMAAVKVPRVPYVLGTLIGMAPRTGIAVFIASLIKGELSRESIADARPQWVIYVAIGASVLVLGIVGFIAKRAINRMTK